jgi:hypothetical protein
MLISPNDGLSLDGWKLTKNKNAGTGQKRRR